MAACGAGAAGGDVGRRVSQQPIAAPVAAITADPPANQIGRHSLSTKPASFRPWRVGDVDAAAHSMGLQIQIFNANTSGEIEAAFANFMRDRPHALFVAGSPFFRARRVQLATLAVHHAIPATYALRDYAEAGGLMSYGTNVTDAWRQIGVYAGRILKGTKAADLPVVQSIKFELVINRQIARLLGLTVPDKLLAIADEVIE